MWGFLVASPATFIGQVSALRHEDYCRIDIATWHTRLHCSLHFHSRSNWLRCILDILWG